MNADMLNRGTEDRQPPPPSLSLFLGGGGGRTFLDPPLGLSKKVNQKIKS